MRRCLRKTSLVINIFHFEFIFSKKEINCVSRAAKHYTILVVITYLNRNVTVVVVVVASSLLGVPSCRRGLRRRAGKRR